MLTIEGNIVNTNGTARGKIEIAPETGLIVKVGAPSGKADYIFEEELIFPGFIDLHVHAREDTSHKEDYKEDFRTAGEAAIAGGVTAFLEMPNNPVSPVDEASYDAKGKLSEKSKAEVVLYAGIGPSTKPLGRKVPYKVFMGKSVGELFFDSLTELENALNNYSGQYVSFHAEDPEILEQNKNESTHESRRPREAEISGIKFALQLIEKYKLHGKICHVSTAEGAELVRAAKKSGIDVTAEVTPHHLFFNSSGEMLQVNPPIRTAQDCQALLQALKDGTLDFLATDHAPHTIAEKEKGISGMPQLDTYGLFAAWLMKEHDFTAEDIARVCSFNPGKFLNEFSSKKFGEIKEGYAASLTVLDLKSSTELRKEMLKTKCGWSPFEGVIFPGRVRMTIVKGKIKKYEE